MKKKIKIKNKNKKQKKKQQQKKTPHINTWFKSQNLKKKKKKKKKNPARSNILHKHHTVSHKRHTNKHKNTLTDVLLATTKAHKQTDTKTPKISDTKCRTLCAVSVKHTQQLFLVKMTKKCENGQVRYFWIDKFSQAKCPVCIRVLWPSCLL